MQDIEQRLTQTRERLEQAASACGRDPTSVQLLAVSKTRPVADILQAYGCGQRHFGENYLQEALPKIAALSDKPICWHFIGPLQANKTRAVAEHFSWVHSVDRLKIARRLSDQRPATLPPLDICLQVNISGEASKAGLPSDQVAECAVAIAALPRLRLRGLMCIPQANPTPGQEGEPFARLRQLLQSLQALAGSPCPDLDSLSMGMSGDLEAAVTEGATWVRVGTGIFGPRQPREA